MDVHTIRLRGPWQYRLLDRGAGSQLPPAGQADVTAEIQRQLTGYQGALELVRRFSRPTNLEPTERVELVIDIAAPGVLAELNDQPLTQSLVTDQRRFDITAQLLPRNTLRLVVDVGEQLPHLDRVRLEIHQRDD